MPNVQIGHVRGITQCDNYEVFDMSLQEGHNFFASGMNVHNCSEPKII